MRRKVLVITVVAAAAALSARRAAADGLLLPTSVPAAETPPILTSIAQLLTGIDLTLLDEAVTDDELATAGCDDSVPTMVDDPMMLVVDDDKQQCPNAQFTSINAAVAAALPGATIRVCPGTYHESVQVTKPGLLIQASRHQGQATECQSPSVPDPTQEAIVVYNTPFFGGGVFIGFFLQADNITVEGFTIQPDPASVGATPGIGVFTDPAFSGYDVRHNVIQNNTFGVDVNSHGELTAYVRQNCLRNNNLNQTQGGFGIFSNIGLNNARIENNYCTQQRNYCILLTGGPNVNVQVTHNESVDDSTIALMVATNVVVDHNKVINPTNTGILLGAGVNTGDVSYNQLYGGPNSGNGISLSAQAVAANPAPAARNLSVGNNKVSNFKWDGIRLGDASTANTVENNRVEYNAMAGIQATGQANNNTIQKNMIRQNHPDCYDDTTGAGTAGTANFWVKNHGQTENRPGLCKHNGNDG